MLIINKLLFAVLRHLEQHLKATIRIIISVTWWAFGNFPHPHPELKYEKYRSHRIREILINNHFPHPANDNEQSWMHGEALQPISLCPRQLISLLHLSRPLRARMHHSLHCKCKCTLQCMHYAHFTVTPLKTSQGPNAPNNAPTMHYTQGLNAPYITPCTSLNQCIAMVDYYTSHLCSYYSVVSYL